MIGYKVRLFSSHRKDKTIEAKGEYFYYRYFICSRSLVEQEWRWQITSYSCSVTLFHVGALLLVISWKKYE